MSATPRYLAWVTFLILLALAFGMLFFTPVIALAASGKSGQTTSSGGKSGNTTIYTPPVTTAPQCTPSASCSGNDLYQKDQSCTTKLVQRCEFGCSAGACNSAPQGATVKKFSTPGAYSWTAPEGVTSVILTVIGGGGGGAGGAWDNGGGSTSCSGDAGNGGAGGAGGVIVNRTTPVVPGQTYAITVGGGGIGGARICGDGPYKNGVSGGSSSFGTLVTAGGGGAGQWYAGGAGGYPNGGGGTSGQWYCNTTYPGTNATSYGNGGTAYCAGSGSSGGNGYVSIAWVGPPPSCTMSIAQDGTLSWSSKNAELFYINGIGYVGASGKAFVPDSTYAGYVSGGGKTATCSTSASVDMCPNIAGDQSAVPSGYKLDASGNCITNNPDGDMCPNLAGIQTSPPAGYTVDSAGECVPSTTYGDVCPNIDGTQTSLPAGDVFDASGNCVSGTGAPTDTGNVCTPKAPTCASPTSVTYYCPTRTASCLDGWSCESGVCIPPKSISIADFTAYAPASDDGVRSTFKATGNLEVRPLLARKGDAVQVYWNVTNAARCSITSDNGDVWAAFSSGANGKTSNALSGQTTFKLHCDALLGATPRSIDQSVTVSIAPGFNEQ